MGLFLLVLDKCQCQAPEDLRETLQPRTGRRREFVEPEPLEEEGIFHTLHHCVAGGQRGLLIEIEITLEL